MRDGRARRGVACALTMLALAAAATASASAGTTTIPAPSSAGKCAHAAGLYAAGYYADAAAAYKKLLGIDPCASAADVHSAQQQLRTQAKSAAALIAAAKKARDAGFEAKSRELVQQLVAQYPDRAIPPSLRDPSQRIGWEQGILGTIGPLLRLLAEALIAALALVALVLLLDAGFRALGERKRTNLLVVPFVGTHCEEAGEATMSALREHLTRLRESTPGSSPCYADSAEHEFALPPAMGTTFPPASVIADLLTLLSRVSPNRPWRVTGTLRPADPVRGAGLTLVLARRREDPIPPLTVWERDFFLVPTGRAAEAAAEGDALLARYQRLALPAAVWLAYRAVLGYDPNLPPLGTRRWRSYASFAVGEDAQELGQDACARRLYDDALVRDAGNLGARANLAAILLTPNRGESAEARAERTRLLREQIAFVMRRLNPAPSNPLWYRVRYVETITLLYAGELEQARGRAVELLRDIDSRLTESDPCAPSALELLLMRMRFPVEILRANADVELFVKAHGSVGSSDVHEPELPAHEWIGANGHYNLACHYARRLEHAPADSDEHTRLRNLAYMHLAQALSFGDDSLRAGMDTDPALESLRRDPDGEIFPAPAPAPARAAAEPPSGDSMPIVDETPIPAPTVGGANGGGGEAADPD